MPRLLQLNPIWSINVVDIIEAATRTQFTVSSCTGTDENSTVANIHWLNVSEHIKLNLAVLTFRSLHGDSPQYLTVIISLISDIPSRRVLKYATRYQTNTFINYGNRAFGTAGLPIDVLSAVSRVWNSLSTVISSPPQDSSCPVFVSYNLTVF